MHLYTSLPASSYELGYLYACIYIAQDTPVDALLLFLLHVITAATSTIVDQSNNRIVLLLRFLHFTRPSPTIATATTPTTRTL